MVIEGKLLAQGRVANTKTALYTVPASKSAFITNMRFYNTSANNETVIVYAIKNSGTSRIVARLVLQQHWLGKEESSFALEEGDSIEAETTNTNVVDFTISGGEV
jgi:hypothetical protein